VRAGMSLDRASVFGPTDVAAAPAEPTSVVQGSVRSSRARIYGFTAALSLFASRTVPVHFQLVVKYGESILSCNLVLERLDALILKLEDLPASDADQVIVVIHIIDELVAGVAVPKLPLFDQSALTEKIQGPVDRCKPYGSVDTLDLSVQFLGRHVTICLQQ